MQLGDPLRLLRGENLKTDFQLITRILFNDDSPFYVYWFLKLTSFPTSLIPFVTLANFFTPKRQIDIVYEASEMILQTLRRSWEVTRTNLQKEVHWYRESSYELSSTGETHT